MTEHVGFLEGVCFESGFEGGKKPERTEGKERKRYFRLQEVALAKAQCEYTEF